jgi:integrase
MASVRKREWTNSKCKGDEKLAAWIADYLDQDGKRHIRTFRRQKDAKDFLRRTLGEVEEGTHTPPRESITVAEAAKAWLRQAEVDELERSTRREYERYVAADIGPLLGRAKLSALTVPSVKEFRNALAGKGRSRTMQNKIVSALGAILADAQASGKVAQNVVHGEVIKNKSATRRRRMVEKRQERQIEEGIDYPTKAEIRALLAAEVPAAGTSGADYHVLIEFAVATGMRASELRGLEWNSIDLDKGIAKVSQRADRWNAVDVPKSKSGQREIPLSSEIVAIMREWKLRCPRRPDEPVKYVFPNGQGNIEHLPNWHNRGLARVHRAAGIKNPNPETKGPKYGMHSLRHVAISLWIEAGMSPKEIQSLAGHSTIQITFDTYGHLWKADNDDAARMSKIRSRLLG